MKRSVRHECVKVLIERNRRNDLDKALRNVDAYGKLTPILDQYSRPDTLPTAVVRSTDGSVRMTVEQGALADDAAEPCRPSH